MNVIQMLQHVAATMLYARVPKGQAARFSEENFFINLQRFATQSIVLVGMDSLSLLVYLWWYGQLGTARGVHVAVIVGKVLLMGACFFYYCERQKRPYRKASPFDRYANILYPALHWVCEFFLFATGPGDFGALIRFLAVPFIMGSIPIMRQEQAAVLNLAAYLLTGAYLYAYTPYGNGVYMPSYILNLGVVYVCSVLVSNIVYSGYANSFKKGLESEHIREALERLNAKLDLVSRRDQLTGLSNRRDFEQYMARTWEAARSRGDTVAVMMLDVDNFKLYNDRFGHLAGDACLVKAAAAVRDCLQGVDHMFARYGGEEFIVVVYGCSPETMARMAERMRKAVEALHVENPDSAASAYLTLSVGLVCQRVRDAGDYHEVVKRADTCLYCAKQNGRNLTVCDMADGAGPTGVDRPLPSRFGGDTEGYDYDREGLQRAIRTVGLDCMFMYAKSHNLLTFSQVAQELLHLPANLANPTVQRVVELLPLLPEDRPAFARQLLTGLAARHPVLEAEVRFGVEYGQKVSVMLRAGCLYDEAGELEVCTGSLLNVQSVLEFSNYAHAQAMTDSISHLPNRKKFYIDMAEKLLRPDERGFVLLFDINNFKSINGIFSHAIGDKALHQVGSLITRITAGEGAAYHYAVDQFIVVLLHVSQKRALEVARLVQDYFLAHAIAVGGISLKVTFSVGAVAFSGGSDVLDDLMVNLDIAVQRAKADKKPQLRFFREQDKREYLARMSFEKELAEAVMNGFAGFALHYQPLFDCHSNLCIGAEALLRWTSATGEQVPPTTVVPLLEKLGLMAETGNWILRTACLQCVAWRAEGNADFLMHVNVAVSQLDRPHFVAELYAILDETGLPRKNLVLEVTEATFVSETARPINAMRTLHREGVGIAVDDFGTGYSSLSYLRALPANIIKIDKGFIEDVQEDPSAREILLSVADLCQSMGFTVCAEGVETPGQMDFIASSQVDSLQGYLLGRPAPSALFTERWFGGERPPAGE